MTTDNNQTKDSNSGIRPDALDSSLDAKAFERAMSGKIPRTMTAWEWEQWYAENGKPASFKPSGSNL
jgi:hypothetical protein